MDETKPKEYTQEQLENMNYRQLREAAIQRKLDYIGKSLKELKLLLGAAPKNATVVDNAEGISAEQLAKRETEKQRVPGKTIYWNKDEKAFWAMKEKNPDAFDNVDFTDVSAKAQHIFNPDVKCVRCKTKFKMRREYQKIKDGVPQTFMDKRTLEVKQCPGCGVWYYYHDPEKETEIFAV